MSTLTLGSLLVFGSLSLGLNAPMAEAHQCVDVRILHAPRQVTAGSQASMVAGVSIAAVVPRQQNWTRGCTIRPVHPSPPGGERVRLREGEFRRARLLLDIPDNIAPGRYQLVLSGSLREVLWTWPVPVSTSLGRNVRSRSL
ncbi:MAG: hypothetical protein CM1200mP2_40070 [Planctomycetaceae bacterium]|nr:MAG: hypothetical protein CM1200mP2_40070 [Planctomycetaceae bacterium]